MQVVAHTAVCFLSQTAAVLKSMFFAALLVVTALSSVDCIPVGELYPFGADAGDNLVPRTDDGSSGEITLNRVYPFYGVDHFSLFVSSIIFSEGPKKVQLPPLKKTFEKLITSHFKHNYAKHTGSS